MKSLRSGVTHTLAPVSHIIGNDEPLFRVFIFIAMLNTDGDKLATRLASAFVSSLYFAPRTKI